MQPTETLALRQHKCVLRGSDTGADTGTQTDRLMDK
jgi:hypothetical protein